MPEGHKPSIGGYAIAVLGLGLALWNDIMVYQSIHHDNTTGGSIMSPALLSVISSVVVVIGIVVLVVVPRMKNSKSKPEEEAARNLYNDSSNKNEMAEAGLVIHSAHYGVDGNEREVTSIVRNTRQNAFELPVNSTTFGCDPASGKSLNRLRVEYSYQGEYLKTSVMDRRLLILPEDRWTGHELQVLTARVEQLQDEIARPQDESGIHSACIRPPTKKVFKVETAEREPSEGVPTIVAGR